MSKFTEDELVAIKKFRAKLQNLDLDDEKNSSEYLMRWLRARDMNVSLAEEMLRKSLKWREEEKVDCILEWCPPEDLLTFVQFEMSGFDNDGSPVYFVICDTSQVETFLNHDKDLITKFVIYTFEKVERQVKEFTYQKAKSSRQVAGIVDCDGIEMLKLVSAKFIAFLATLANIVLNNYPELEKILYLINTPRIFTFCFSLVKHLVPARTIGKMRVFGCNKNQWVDGLLNDIPADQLPLQIWQN